MTVAHARVLINVPGSSPRHHLLVHKYFDRVLLSGQHCFPLLYGAAALCTSGVANALARMAGGAVLQQIDFVVPRGALAVVLGNSGSGKTTLLRGIMQVVFTCPCTR